MFHSARNQNSPHGAETPRLRAISHLMEQADVISFDIFDTLLIRPLTNPTDVFLLMERQSNLPGLHTARIKAEFRAREKQHGLTGSHEVTLAQIYQELKLPSASPETLRTLPALEIATETTLLRHSPSVARIYDLAVSLGKKIIAISDMYLPADVLKETLTRNGLPVEKVFVSCDYRASKHEGKLYPLVAQDLGVKPSQILHFGDNFKSDCSSALKQGIVGYFIPSLNSQLQQDARYNPAALKRLTRLTQGNRKSGPNLFASLTLASIARFKAENPDATIASQFGAMYGGPMVTGFATWLNRAMQADKVQHLRLATRDGYITQSIWNRLGFTGQASILQSSRRLTILPTLYTAFDKEIETLLNTNTSCTLRHCIERLNLGPDQEDLLNALQAHTPIDQTLSTPSRVSAALSALKNCKPILQRAALREMTAYKTYLQNEGFNPKTDAMVDCGWALSSQKRKEIMLGETFRGYYIGTLEHAHMHSGIRSFLFHKGSHRQWNAIAERGVELLELPFASTQPQVSSFRKTESGVEPVLTKNQRQYDLLLENFIHQMQDEILTFADNLKPFTAILTLKEIQDTLFALFNALVRSPTAHEYHELATLPHSRELGASGFGTIGTIWITPHTNYAVSDEVSRWQDYLRMGWISLRQGGLRVTWIRTKRVFRRHLK